MAVHEMMPVFSTLFSLKKTVAIVITSGMVMLKMIGVCFFL